MPTSLKLLMLLAVVFVISMPLIASAELGSPMPAPIPQVSPGANKGPTVEEILQWIKEKVEDDKNVMFVGNEREFRQIRVKQTELEYNGCNVTVLVKVWKNDISFYKYAPSKLRKEYMPEYIIAEECSLADFDPTNTVVKEFDYDLNPAGYDKGIIVTLHATGRAKPIRSNSSSIATPSGWYLPSEFFKLSKQGNQAKLEVLKNKALDMSTNEENVKTRDELSFNFIDPSLAQRANTAFRDAIKLCQQQRKETVQPQKKELY